MMPRLLLGLLVGACAWAATPNPVHWSVIRGPEKALRPGAKFTVKVEAQIDSGWHLYAMDQEEGGPVSLEFSVPENSGFELGPVRSSKPVQLFDPNFQKRVRLYVDKAEFSLPMSVSARAASAENGTVQVRYQSCNDTMCLPPKTVKLDLE